MNDHARALASVIVGASIVLIAVIATDDRLSDPELLLIRGLGLAIMTAAGLGLFAIIRRGGG